MSKGRTAKEKGSGKGQQNKETRTKTGRREGSKEEVIQIEDRHILYYTV
jgi:hypothetical protein